MINPTPIAAAPSYSQAFLAMDATRRGICQACGREIGVKHGVIAHHGYQRPFGWGEQTASCFGARELPYEVDKRVLEGHVNACFARLTELQARIANLRNDADGNVVIRWEERAQFSTKNARVPYTIIVENQQHLDDMRAEMIAKNGRNALPWAYSGWDTKSYAKFKAAYIAELESEERQRTHHLNEQRKRLAAWVNPGLDIDGYWRYVAHRKASGT